MTKKKKDEAIGVLALIVGAPVFFANWIHEKIGIPQPATYTLLVLCIIVGLWFYFSSQHRRFRAIQIANIDSMGGIQFEHYLRKLLSNQGYSVTMTQASGDLGVDLVAARGPDRIAIQAKRYNSKVSRRAISDAVAGMQHYRCNRAMVITNSHFTPGAVTLARSTNCILVDRDTLALWIIQLQNTQSS
jgi:restriction system protein